MYKNILTFILLYIATTFSYNELWDDIYDQDSITLVEILDTNSFNPALYFYDCIKLLVPDTLLDTAWRISMLYLDAGTINDPSPLPGKLKYLPHSIVNLNYLTTLEVDSHELEYLPKEIGYIKMMQVLDFRYNPLKEIPSELSQCDMLFYLGLANTDITSMPDEFLDLDSIRPCNIAVDTINGNIYPRNVIDLCGLENFTLTARQKAWAEVADYEEYKQKYCQQSDIVIPDKKHKPVNPSGIAVKITGYSMLLTLEREGLLSLSLFDSRGKKVRAIIDKKVVSKGSLTIQMDRNISAGVYFLRGSFSGVAVSGKVIIEGGI